MIIIIIFSWLIQSTKAKSLRLNSQFHRSCFLWSEIIVVLWFDLFFIFNFIIGLFHGRCGHCKKLAPEYEKLGSSFKKAKSVLIGKVSSLFTFFSFIFFFFDVFVHFWVYDIVICWFSSHFSWGFCWFTFTRVWRLSAQK